MNELVDKKLLVYLCLFFKHNKTFLLITLETYFWNILLKNTNVLVSTDMFYFSMPP